MNGSKSSDAHPDTADPVNGHAAASEATKDARSPQPVAAAEEESRAAAVRAVEAPKEVLTDPVSNGNANKHVTANGGDDDVASEAETLIDSPVKKREAEKQAENQRPAVKAERSIRSRIGSLPVPGEDDEESESVATPMQSTEMGDTKANSSADAKGEDVDMESDRDSSSEPLSSAQSPSGSSRALSQGTDVGLAGAESRNPRKRKHRASSVSLPNKRQSMEPPKRRLRGMHSEDVAGRLDRSPSPPGRSHRRAASTQSAFMDGSADAHGRKRRAVTQFPVRDPKTAKTWEESDASSETTSHGQIEARRPQRGVGRSTSTPGRPVGRERKRHVNKYGFTRLAEACEEGDLELVKEWREKDPDQLELAEFAKNKPLQIAALKGNVEVVEYLIDQGCQIDCANVDKDTPLIDAAENGHLEVVKILLKAGVDPLRQNLKGRQALDVVTDETDEADGIRAALRDAIEHWNSNDAKKRREEEEEQRHQAGPSKELHFMARTYENLLKLVTNNERTGVREFLDARVPVDNVIIAAAAKTGDAYLISMLLAEMTDKKAYQKAEKPMLAVLGTSHFDMVKMLTELDQFNATWRSRSGKSWPELAEERNGPHWREEKALLQRLYDAKSSKLGRRSSSPVTKRNDHAKRRLPQLHEDDDSEDDDEEAGAAVPKRKGGRRLVSRRDMRGRAALSDTDSEEGSTSDTGAAAEDPEPLPAGRNVGSRVVMRPPESPTQRRESVGRQRTKSLSSQPAEASSPKGRRKSTSSRGMQDASALPTLQEKAEDMGAIQKDQEEQAKFAIAEAKRLEAKRQDEEAAEAEAKRAEDEAKKAEEEARRVEEEREAEEARKKQAEDQARKDEEEREAAEERRKREVEMEGARSTYRRDVLAALPDSLAQTLDSTSGFSLSGSEARGHLLEHCTPLYTVAMPDQHRDLETWVLNVQAAPLLGRRGLELLLPAQPLGFQRTFCADWEARSGLEAHQNKIKTILRQLASQQLPTPTPTAEGEDRFQAQLRRAAARLNAQADAERRLRNGTIKLEMVKLTDVLANLDPLLKDFPLETCSLGPTRQAAEVKASLDNQGVADFVSRMGEFWARAPLKRRFVNGEEQVQSQRACMGSTPVIVVHEK